MHVLLVLHGYPPRENAGTERHAATLAAGLRARGHRVSVLAATRAPGRRQYALLREGAVTRIVQNVPARPLSAAERDRAVEAAARRLEAELRPDLVHVHHLQFLSSGLRFRAPVVLTLHDAWLWCPAGGTLLRDGAPCPGPEPGRCAACAAAWAPVPGRRARALVALAGLAAPLVAPERLHRAWSRLPETARAPVRRGRMAVESPEAATRRNAAMRRFARSAALRLAPSRFLARTAEREGLGPVEVLPHGVPEGGAPRGGGGPLLFLGTLARHKGPDLVVEAWRRAFPGGRPGLALHGPPGDAVRRGRVAGHPVSPPLDRAGVRRALAGATALVMGSRWPENAPLVILEARAAGCPVVAPRLGGIPELVEEGRDGWLYAPGDADDLARALRRLLAEPPGPPRPPPTADAMVEATLARYRAVLGGG